MAITGCAPSGPRSRRLIGVLASGAVLAALLAATPAGPAGAAGAADEQPVKGAGGSSGAAADGATSRGASGDLQRFRDGRYVVLLRAPSATSYGGGTGSYAATRSAAGRFDPRSPRVAAYAGHLRRTQTSLARSVGAQPLQRFTIATNGFVADLSRDQALELAADRRTLLVEPSTTLKPDTWNTPDFLGLSGRKGAWAQHGGQRRAGAGVVVGVLDSGIWPESKSFAGARLTRKAKGPWDISRRGEVTRMEKADGTVFRGRCVIAERWNAGDCNTKLIGARFYGDSFLQSVPREELAETEQLSTRDGDGHGSHTASTAAGNVVRRVVTEGRRFGTVSGMAPDARVAAYKVCWEAANPDDSGCNNIDSIAAVEQAVIDGVDVINFSVGGGASPTLDGVELAFEGAAEAGIFVATSAGNSGPGASTLDHPSPWLTTVAATTHYNFENTIVLGDGTKIVGASIATKPVPRTRLVDADTAPAAGSEPGDSALCGPGSLDPAKVRGKMVICLRGVYDRVAKSEEVKRAGGVAMILVNPSANSLDADFHAVPTIHISDTDGTRLFRYLERAGSAAVASFVLGNQTRRKTPLPQVAAFSSRGPILVSDGDMLKPDISAPGVSVLAAVAPPAHSGRRYDLISGTSMASPHIAGLAAFILGERPSWTPMQVKSAMMTTAAPTKTAKGGRSRDALAQGAGQVRPRRFFDPGLFVTSGPVQWRGFLTSQGIDTGTPALDAKQVNLPSFADGSLTSQTTFRRTFRATRAGVWRIKANVPGFRVRTTPARIRADGRNDLVDVRFTFTRTSAPLGRWAKGAVNLQGPTALRLPVALKPVSVAAPRELSGAGASGSLTVPLTAGFTGDLDVDTHGLAASETVRASVAAGAQELQCVTVPRTSDLARFAVDSIDDTADLDLTVYAASSCDPATAYALAGQSATASGDEAVTIRGLAAGTYIAAIDGFSAGTAGSPMAYDFDFWNVDTTATAGALQVSPNPVPVRANERTTARVSWSGLAPDTKYLGFLSYQGSTDITVLNVTSP